MAVNDHLSRREFLDRSMRFGAAGIAAGYLPSATAKPTDGPWQIGCYTRPWDKYEYRFALDAIAEAGYRHVGLMTTKSKNGLIISVETTLEEAQVVGAEAKKRKLSVASVYGGGIPVGASLDAGIAGLRKLIDNCAACGAKNLLMGGIGNEKLYKSYYNAIAECCDYAAEKGIGISVKPHGGLNATGSQCRKTIEMIGHENFRIWYDPGNIYYYSNAELDPVDDAPTVDGLVIGMSVKDYVHPKNVLVTPGEGMVDFSTVFRRLYAGGFRKGPLIVECLKPGDQKQLLAEAIKARRFLEEQTAELGRAGSNPTTNPQLQAGISVVDITPPVPYRMSGYFRERLSTGVANRLFAKAVVFGQGKEKAAMVFCDIIGLSPVVSANVRRIASDRAGISADNIVITATHTHTGPLYWGALRDHFHDKAVVESGSDAHEQVDYPSKLTEGIVEAICKANADVKPASLRTGKTVQEGLSFNRRFHMKNGTVRFNPGVLNPDIVRVAGPIDPEVGMVFIYDATKRQPVGAIVNFALHLDTVGGSEYAADYPYYLEKTLREEYGEKFVLFFGTGTCGDINHIDVTRRERLKTDEIGTTLGKTVISNSDKLRGCPYVKLAAMSVTADVPLQEFSDEEIAWARENVNKVGTRELSFIEQVTAYKILARQSRPGGTIGLEVQVVRLSRDIAMVFVPGEVFVDIGLEIKRRSPFAETLVVELSQDAPGYIPTRKAFDEGSYETVNSRIAPGGGEAMTEVAVSMLKRLAVR